MKAPYSLPNGLSIEEGHLWNKRMEAFHALHPLLSAEEGRKHPTSDPMDAFALFSLYMIKAALNANYVCTRSELLKDASFEKTAKEALSAEELKYKQLQEEKPTMELDYAKKYSTLKAEMLKLKNDHSSLAKDVEDSRSASLEATKRAEDAKARALKAEERLVQTDAAIAQQIEKFKTSGEGDLFVGKEAAAAVYGFMT
ncbi:hypothetical protein LIER_30157 [Lithospermum erythrorhizon]|uniref:Uncharacterized protein n=1 Tax=Lithospermum erythrorhizon TaxID=34254 RepID=A0AAV3RNW1_LITER